MPDKRRLRRSFSEGKTAQTQNKDSNSRKPIAKNKLSSHSRQTLAKLSPNSRLTLANSRLTLANSRLTLAKLSPNSRSPSPKHFTPQNCLLGMNPTPESLQYPVGRFTAPATVSDEEIKNAIQVISDFPNKLERAVSTLSADQLNTPYREGGWTIRQVVHHCADSHMNAFIRFKWAMSEENPVIKAYKQDLWANHPEYQLDIHTSLMILKGLHARWTNLMQSMSPSDWLRTYVHPEQQKQFSLRQVVMNYEWHCRHHLAHVVNAVERF